MPGYMVPDDIGRMYAATKKENETLDAWALRTLRASPGATMGIKARGDDGKMALHVIRVGTLVPAVRHDGHCINLDPNSGRCKIHEVSPFGCAFVDSHMSQDEANAISTSGLSDLLQQMLADAPTEYYRIWEMLREAGKVAPAPAEARARLLADHPNPKETVRDKPESV
jgi:Fe-S-cluster containining protein